MFTTVEGPAKLFVEMKNSVYADKAYDKEELREELEGRGIKDKIMYKAHRGRPLKPWQEVV